ncbi:hypothetical protein WM93_00250 [Klebsiella pneumoniae]|nr:hypothetical protein WM93_00250 [Klebsiella pneumoniae]STT35968.1 Uncharacterised protein [Klebsiella pneumoniae]STW92913.1 Uncharacterised protein [Klebsiella pneumoniae]
MKLQLFSGCHYVQHVSPDTMRLRFWTGKNIEFKSKVDICLILKKSLRELVLLIYLSHLILFF